MLEDLDSARLTGRHVGIYYLSQSILFTTYLETDFAAEKGGTRISKDR